MLSSALGLETVTGVVDITGAPSWIIIIPSIRYSPSTIFKVIEAFLLRLILLMSFNGLAVGSVRRSMTLAFSVSPVATTSTWKVYFGISFSLMCAIIFGKDET